MLRRSIVAIALLAVIGGAGAYLWKARGRTSPRPAATALPGKLADGAQAFGVGAREKLSQLGHGLRDAKLTASVKTALSLNRNLRPYSIDVASEDGVVTLRGRVDASEERVRAEAVAAAVPDVTRVVSQIQVLPSPAAAPGRTLGESLEDETLELRVRLALSLHRELRGTDITIQAYRREVTLGGEVASHAQRERALETARETTAVAGVVDRIRVRLAATRSGASSAERAAAAQRAVHGNPNLAVFDLQVVEEGGRLVLRGAVHTPVEKDLAFALAREAAGGGVDDAVEVRAGA